MHTNTVSKQVILKLWNLHKIKMNSNYISNAQQTFASTPCDNDTFYFETTPTSAWVWTAAVELHAAPIKARCVMCWKVFPNFARCPRRDRSRLATMVQYVESVVSCVLFILHHCIVVRSNSLLQHINDVSVHQRAMMWCVSTDREVARLLSPSRPILHVISL